MDERGCDDVIIVKSVTGLDDYVRNGSSGMRVETSARPPERV
jgi:hypothetical protein